MTLQVQGQSNVYGTTAGTVKSAGTQASASIFNEKPQTSHQTQEEKNELVQKFEAELNKLLSNYKGITAEELKEIANEAGFKKRDGDILTEEKVAKMLKYIQEALDKSSEIDEEGNKVVNKDKLKIHYKESYKKILESVKKGLGVILEKYLPKGKTILNATPEEFKAAVEKFLTESIKQIKGKKLTPEQIKQQQNEFKALLAATPDELKVKIWDAAKSLLSENGQIKEAITEMIKSFVTPENLKKYLSKISQEDLEKLGINTTELTQAVEKAAKDGNPEAIVDLLDSLVNIVEDFYKNNNETIDRCRTKIAEYKKQNNIGEKENLEESTLKEILGEDYEVYKSLTNVEAMFSGGSIGAVEKGVDVNPWFKHMQEQGINMNNIYAQMKIFIENHKDELSLSVGELRDILNKATNDEYGKVTGDISPKTEASSESKTSKDADLGYSQDFTESAISKALANIEYLKQSLTDGETNEKYTVEKNNSKTTYETKDNKNDVYTSFSAYLKGDVSFEKLVFNFSKIKNRTIQEDVAEKVSKLRERTDFIKNNLLAIMVNTKKKFDSEEIKELKRNGVSGIVLDGLRTDEVG